MAVEWPLLHSDTFKRLALKAPRGILLHGPPGCSKITLVRAAVSQGRTSIIRLNGADIYPCYLGEAERILREGLQWLERQRQVYYSLVKLMLLWESVQFKDLKPMEMVFKSVFLSILLTEMDGIVSAIGVLVIGATNRVDLLDDALLRPGRFNDILEVGMPDEAARLEILRIHTVRLPFGEDVNLPKLAQQTAGKSAAELVSLCVEAGLATLRDAYVSAEATFLDATSYESNLIVMSRHFGMVR